MTIITSLRDLYMKTFVSNRFREAMIGCLDGDCALAKVREREAWDQYLHAVETRRKLEEERLRVLAAYKERK